MKKKLYIIADSSDSTITLSEELCKELEVSKGDPRIFVFKIRGTKEFAFKRVPVKFANTTPHGIVSKNPLSGKIGFASPCPTVNLMFYQMEIKSKEKKLHVQKLELPDKSMIYKIIAPKKPWFYRLISLFKK